MEQLQEIVFRHIKALDEKFLATVCGSFRRGMNLIGWLNMPVVMENTTQQINQGMRLCTH